METPTPEQIEAAQAVLKAADAATKWPKGSHLVSTFVCLGETRITLNAAGFDSKTLWRELTPAELDILRSIPECSKALEGK